MDTHGISSLNEMSDGIEKMFCYYQQWKLEREKSGNELLKERYDPETEELLRENLIAKVISVQQMFEKPESTPKMNSCTKKRKAAIMNMAQITSILKMMAEARPTKKKRKKHKVSVAPPPKVEKPKLIPLEGYLNLSSLLPKVDMKKMQTRSFRWSRERMTSLIEDYVNSDHIKENAKLEHLHGIKPVLLKLDFTREVSLPITPQWNSLPESQSMELESEAMGSSDSPKPRLEALDNKSQYNRRNSRDSRRLSSCMSQRIPSAASSKFAPSRTASPRKMSVSQSQGQSDVSKFSKTGGTRFFAGGFNAIEEESNDGHDTESIISPFGFATHRMSREHIGFPSFENSPTHMLPQDELKRHELVVDKQRYYRKWWEKKKKSYKPQVQFDCPNFPEPKTGKRAECKLPKSPPYQAHLDLHQTFVGFNPEESLGKEKLEQYRKRRLEELFLDVKKFVDLQGESGSKLLSRKLHTVR